MSTRSSERPEASLEIKLLGGFDVRVGGKPAPALRSRRERWLFALLVLRPNASRKSLANTLWPDAEESQALFYLRKALSNLRHALGPEAGRISSAGEALCFDTCGAQVDVLSFDRHAEDGNPQDMAAAVAAYRGPLLPDCQEDWISDERTRREIAYLRALERLSEISEPAEAVRWLRRLVAADPYRESAVRSLMRTLAEFGDRAAVTSVYRELQSRLLQDLNLSPSPETENLFRELLRRPAVAFARAEPSIPCQKRRRLPVPLTDLVGRTQEVEEILSLLGDRRLVTLVGAGGIGKTRLSIAVAEAALSGFEHGAWFVDLSSLTDNRLVSQAVARTLGIPEEPALGPLEGLAEVLEPRRLLIVLDNCEHVSEACAALARFLLTSCFGLTILSTSRQPLHVEGEHVYRVPGLPVPPAHGFEDSVELARNEAVRLFMDRAERANCAFSLNARNAESVAEICRRLDGIPLAIELAAARIRSLSIWEVSRRLEDRFRILTVGSQTTIPRQRTLRSLIDWSFDLLTEAERALLCRLSVFAGGWNVDAAESVCAGEPLDSADVLDLLSSLVDQSLVIADVQRDVTRFRFLETIRQYAADRLQELGSLVAWRNRHLAHFLGFAEEAHLCLFGPDEGAWMDKIELEHENLRLAFAWATERDQNPDAALRLCVAIFAFWITRGYYQEGEAWCRAALNCARNGPRNRGYALTLDCAAALALRVGDFAAVQSHVEAALSLYREIGDERGVASSLNLLGIAAREQGDYASARSYHAQSLAIRRQDVDDPGGLTQALFNLGRLELELGDFDSARSFLEESVDVRRQMGWSRGFAMPLAVLGEVALEQADYPAALTCLEESLSTQREIEDRSGTADTLFLLGRLAWAKGEVAAALALHKECLSIRSELGLKSDLAASLAAFAQLAAEQGEGLLAASLWGAAEALRERVGRRESPRAASRRQAGIAVLKAAVGDEEFESAWNSGRTMPLEQAIARALAVAESGIA